MNPTLRKALSVLLTCLMLLTAVPAGLTEEIPVSAVQSTQGPSDPAAEDGQEGTEEEPANEPEHSREVPAGAEEAPCPHEHTERKILETKTVYKPFEYDHGVYERVTYDEICSDCGAVLAEGKSEDKWIESVDHSWNDSGVCQVCGYACDHERTRSQIVSTEDWYEDNGDGTQTHHYVQVVDTVCRVCGATIRETNEWTDDHRKHSFDFNGRCTVCGYQCPHEKTRKHETDNWEEWISDGAATHTFWMTHQYDLICDTCKSELDWGLTWQEAMETAPHRFLDGECQSCGYVCPHENLETTASEEIYRCEPLDDETHEVYGLRREEYACPDCGFSDWEENEGLLRTEPHRYENGVCGLCGAECPHTKTGETNVRETGRTYEDNGDGTHAETIHERYDLSCLNCGLILSEDQERTTRGEDGSHSYANGACQVCGAPCPHAETVRRYRSIEGEAWKDNGDDTHTRTFDQSYDVVCAICGAVVDSGWEHQADEPLPHEYSEGACEICGAPCPHAHPVEDFGVVDTYYRLNGDDTHTLIRVSRESVHCEDCGQVLVPPHEVQTELETGEHVEGERTLFDDPIEYLDNGDGTHTMVHTFLYNRTCAICGGAMDRISETQTSPAEAHEFEQRDTEDGSFTVVCAACGYVCPHEHTVPEDQGGEHYFESRDETRHTEYVRMEVDDYCPDCRFYMGNYREEVRELETGEHVEGSRELSDSFYTYADDGAGAHTVTLTEVYDRTCSVCGGAMAAETVTTELPSEAHRYGEDGVCIACGAAKPEEKKQKSKTETSAEETAAAPDIELMAMMERLGRAYQPKIEAGEVTVEILHLDELLTPEELQAVNALPLQQRLLCALIACGFDSEVSRAARADRLLTPEASGLVDAILARMNGMDPQALSQLRNACFPVTTIDLNGQRFPCYCVELRITEGGTSRTDVYGFRNEGGRWLLTTISEGALRG